MRPQYNLLCVTVVGSQIEYNYVGTMSVVLNVCVCAKLESMDMLCIISSLKCFINKMENKDNNDEDYDNVQVDFFLSLHCCASYILDFNERKNEQDTNNRSGGHYFSSTFF